MGDAWSLPDIRTPLGARADLYQRLREFMRVRDILEVETPTLCATATPDPNLHSLDTTLTLPDGRQRTLYLHTSPEYAMKRLLADGSGAIYQICKVFRDEEAGRVHNPEFSMLEWYRPHFDSRHMMDEIGELLEWLGFRSPQRVTYEAIFRAVTGLNPHTCATAELQLEASKAGFASEQAERSELLDFLFDHIRGDYMQDDSPYMVHDFPACQAALARLRHDNWPVAERFELFINDLEIANGFYELNDSAEQRWRFLEENRIRKQNGRPQQVLDEAFLAALDALPECAGVAMGLDRLLMCMTGATCIEDVLPFVLDAK
jgi:lysyl-tRNA synthetase class 2